MLARLWSLLSKKKNVKQQRIAELEELMAAEMEDDDDDEKTEMIDTLAYHQPPKHVIAEKARQLAENTNA